MVRPSSKAAVARGYGATNRCVHTLVGPIRGRLERERTQIEAPPDQPDTDRTRTGGGDRPAAALAHCGRSRRRTAHHRPRACTAITAPPQLSQQSGRPSNASV